MTNSLDNIHKNFKEKYIINEFYNPKEIKEFECYFRLRINANKTDARLEDVIVYTRGINGVTIVRSGETTKRNEANIYSTRMYVKYTPQTFNSSATLDQIYAFLEKEIRNFGPALSLSRLSPLTVCHRAV